MSFSLIPTNYGKGVQLNPYLRTLILISKCIKIHDRFFKNTKYIDLFEYVLEDTDWYISYGDFFTLKSIRLSYKKTNKKYVLITFPNSFLSLLINCCSYFFS